MALWGSMGVVAMGGGVRRGWLWLVKNGLNRATVPAARAGLGPLALVRHVGRKSGKTYETPLLLARVQGGFVAELTYGEKVDWYRNVVRAGTCTVVVGGREYRIDEIRDYPYRDGRRAFGRPASYLLKALGRKEFRFLRSAG